MFHMTDPARFWAILGGIAIAAVLWRAGVYDYVQAQGYRFGLWLTGQR